MKIENNTATDTKAKAERLAKLQRKIDQALSKKTSGVETTFSEAYELIEMAMKQGLSQKDVIALLNDSYDLKLHAASFRKLLNDERSTRGADGRSALCPTCRHPLALQPQAGPEATANDITSNDKMVA
ncbi:hypothetical protein HMPREF3113_09440 [Stenotrophomonas sp. HMSC10F06]|jgi:hypothetical protein|uniref:hypothetical protein n=1 Tax=Stenotrophomonas sp. HMSC10F06 TaxID=1581081 RepID=UPI0008A22D4C|nr:hypothetical protein [Stenotrophomonas sp. HMSC10F06]OFS93575.1 hypothetical protein HMPREF3113_09440 [Stenotrophomonas sp. HMSC10F06]HEL3872920.1 hypothetical protein [Stenotrophomonas maltophilia]